MRRRRHFKRPAQPAHQKPALPPIQIDSPLRDAPSPPSELACRPQCEPVLETWPHEYRGGGFKLDGQDVLIFAKGRPDLRIPNVL